LRADALRNREHLLGVARQVFASEGLEVPIDEVARRAGLGIGTVYRHFPNKEALFEAIIIDELERLLVHAETLQRDADPEPAFVGFLEKYLAAGAAKRDFTEALLRSGRGPLPPPPVQEIFARVRAALGRLLTSAQKAGAIRTDIGVDETLALLHGVSAASVSYGGPPEQRPRLWAVVLDGLRSRLEPPVRPAGRPAGKRSVGR
jgi:AcrR family transcriptional regulator